MGLDEVARNILQGRSVDLARIVGSKPELKDLKTVVDNVVNAMADLLNKMPETLEVIKKIAKMETRARLTVCCDLSNKAKKWTENDKSYRLISNFKDYVNFKKNARCVENYQILAMDRGEENDVLTWKVDVENADELHPGHKLRIAPEHRDVFQIALKDSVNRLFLPKIQRTVRRQLLSRAEEAAISCFAHNLRQLFWREGLIAETVIALDPGFSACKAALLTSTGSVVETAEFGLSGKSFDGRGENLLKQWVARSGDGRVVVAIGNGKASFETQMAVAGMIRSKKFMPKDVRFCTVPENGASKYSITPLAEEDLPNMPPTQRSAVSIGRRLIDPMAEYVKIEPKHLGMGMYQHSVNAKRLSEALELVVRECVSMRGVDVNVASVQLLEKVCGLNKKTAAGLVALREKMGRIQSREDIKLVKGLGAKSFEQCAGFLTVHTDSENASNGPVKKKRKISSEPLDKTIVHPSQYDTARRLLSRVGLSPSDLPCHDLQQKLRNLTNLEEGEALVRDLLCTDIKTLPPPDLMTDIRKIGSLKVGEEVMGRVSNQVEFGLFVDIGAEKSALAHRSTLRQPYPEVGTSLMFVIVSIDQQKGRIGVRPVS
ncbi:S1 RNA-binding domain-containing protein 1 [Trichostrongylus colubriformis]|uniref:S1 RNA-binding domain-containing protein 1 n=1 Tax=Trichostrongylus colubriformis TaxID=6319 RepID=A0AAN8EWI1_TRICO